MKNPLLLSTVLPALMLLSPFVCHADDAPSALVSITQVVRQPLHDQLTFYGKVTTDPAHTKTLSSLRSGIIEQLMIAPGEAVAQGQPLLTLANSPQTQRAYAQAQALLAGARAQFQLNRDLFNERLATKADLASAQQNLDSATATLKALVAQGAGHVVQVLRATAPTTVIRVDVAPGVMVQPGQTLMTLGSRSHLWVRLGIEPEEATLVRPGMPVALRAVFGTASVHAEVAQVHTTVDPDTHLVDAVVKLTGKETNGLVPGSWMRGTLDLQTRITLGVPRSAVLSDDNGHYVFVVRNGHAHRVAVQTGVESAGLIAVSGALREGDTVVTRGNYELSDGMAVRLAVEPAQ
jgi:RND family efflux transporter MFP subunit